MVEVEEEETPLPISCRNDHKDQFPMDKNDVVINVKDCTPLPIKHSIYKIPKSMKNIQPKAYEPYYVSFGPYHHGVKDLAPGEKEKEKVFQHLVKGDNDATNKIKSEVSNILKDLYDAYDSLDEKWKNDDNARAQFMHMMIRDACFLLVFLSEDEHDKSLITLKSEIRRDILLLENQLPFQLLQCLYYILPIKVVNKNLITLIENNLFLKDNKHPSLREQTKHILELYRMSILYPVERVKRMERVFLSRNNERNYASPSGWRHIFPQATELRKMGIKFKRNTKGLLNVYFDPKQGVLGLPYLEVSNDLGTHLLNVMAFEKLYLDRDDKAVVSYVRFMKNLIVDDKDVLLLISYGILSQNEISTSDVVKLFNQLAQGTNKYQFNRYLSKVCLDLNYYYYWDKPWTRWWVNFRDPRTQKPWVIISIAGASITFLLQIIQTTIQVCEHFRSNH